MIWPYLITDPPDPNCPNCRGTGVRGGCYERGHPTHYKHQHTLRFCECVNERMADTGDSE